MKYKKSFEEIMKQLTTYKIEVDELAIAYVTEKTRHEKELQKAIYQRSAKTGDL